MDAPPLPAAVMPAPATTLGAPPLTRAPASKPPPAERARVGKVALAAPNAASLIATRLDYLERKQAAVLEGAQEIETTFRGAEGRMQELFDSSQVVYARSAARLEGRATLADEREAQEVTEPPTVVADAAGALLTLMYPMREHDGAVFMRCKTIDADTGQLSAAWTRIAETDPATGAITRFVGQFSLTPPPLPDAADASRA
jgi:hypothetical protein